MARRHAAPPPDDAAPVSDDAERVPLQVGQPVWYVKAGETCARPAVLISEGICETRKLPTGQLLQYAHLGYATLDPGHALLGNAAAVGPNQRQTYEVTAPWDPSGGPGTWHLDGEAEGCTHPARIEAP